MFLLWGGKGVVLGLGLAKLLVEGVGCLFRANPFFHANICCSAFARRGNYKKKKNRKRKKEIDYSHCINLQASAGCNFLQFLAVKSKSVHFVSAAFVCDLYFEN